MSTFVCYLSHRVNKDAVLPLPGPREPSFVAMQARFHGCSSIESRSAKFVRFIPKDFALIRH